jgi:hypothetical protein
MRTVKQLSEKEKSVEIGGSTMSGKLIVELITEDNLIPSECGLWYYIDHSLPFKKEILALTFISNDGQVWFKEHKGQWELLLG